MYVFNHGSFTSSVESYLTSFPLFNQVSFTLNADAQALSSSISPPAAPGSLFLCIGLLDNTDGTDEEFIFGMAALERFYAVLDTNNQRVGLAYTPFTNGTFNT